MPLHLKKENLTISIDLPYENYQGSRFDWTGKIVEFNFKGIPFTSYEQDKFPNDKKFGMGLYNEFGMENALNFSEVKEGELFHKIGVGLLKKVGAQYDFLKSYDIKPAQFETKHFADRIVFRCISENIHGFAYVLEKEFVIHPYGIEVYYRLENRGQNDIISKEYCHNFISINGQGIGPDYKLDFPFNLKKAQFEEVVDPEKIVQFRKKGLNFKGSPNKPFFFSNLSGGENVEGKWKLENAKSKMAISESLSKACNSVNLWGWGHVISPELFFDINVKPGASLEWKRSFEISEIR